MSDENTVEEGKKEKSTIFKKILIVSLSIIAFIAIIIGSGYWYVRNEIYSDLDDEIINGAANEITNNSDEVEYTEVDGIINVLLIGQDSRGGDDVPKSDSMIIATLDSNNKNIKLTSLYRDTLVNIPGHGKDRLNAAFTHGGKELLIATINNTYNINIDKYITIDFSGFETIIDKMGGIEVDVKDYQIEELNKYIGESTGGNDCPVTETGLQTLNGKQALSYARIRKGVGDDYERVERQREVLVKVAEKLTQTKPSKYLGISKDLLKYIETNIEPISGLNMAYTIYKFPTLDIKQLSIPLQELCIDKNDPRLGDVLVMDRVVNSEILNSFIFENKIPEEYDTEDTSLNEQ